MNDFFNLSIVLVTPPPAPRVRQDTEDSRCCLSCGRIAWYEKTDEDGYRIYLCSVGHQIVERPTPEPVR